MRLVKILNLKKFGRRPPTVTKKVPAKIGLLTVMSLANKSIVDRLYWYGTRTVQYEYCQYARLYDEYWHQYTVLYR